MNASLLPDTLLPDASTSLAPAPSPAEELGALVSWSATVFYLAESGANPGVTSYWDALHYVATSLSVGYANIFPVTAVGKTVGSVLMMVGPALSARALDNGRALEHEASVPELGSGAIVERLDAILEELRRARPG